MAGGESSSGGFPPLCSKVLPAGVGGAEVSSPIGLPLIHGNADDAAKCPD